MNIIILLLCISLTYGASLQFSLHPTSQETILEFSVYNPNSQPVFVLKRFTPLEGIMSDCFHVKNSNGTVIAYDGVVALRQEQIDPDEFLYLAPQSVYTKQIDISRGYGRVKQQGGYTVSLKVTMNSWAAQRERSPAEMSRMLETEPLINDRANVEAYIQTTGVYIPRAESLNGEVKEKRGSSVRPALAVTPTLSGFTAAQGTIVYQAHRTAVVYMWASAQLQNYYNSNPTANQQYINYFGAYTSARYSTVTAGFNKLYNALTSNTLSYTYDGGCASGTIAYTYKGLSGQPIWLCPTFFNDAVVPFSSSWQNKYTTIIHEASHGWLNADDNNYGIPAAKSLASSNPAAAIACANNIGIYGAMSFPLDWGFDTINTTPAGTFATIGPIYFKYTGNDASTIATGYPRTINGNWGSTPSTFDDSFDSMVTLNNMIYVTKGSSYLRYSSPYNTPDSGYPLSIQGNWGNTDANFNSGFDSAAKLPTGPLYVTRGSQYNRYSDGVGSVIDAGYPKAISGNWPTPFSKFDAMFTLNTGTTPAQITYIISGSQYTRCADDNCNTAQFTRALRGYWGQMPYYQ